MSFDAQQLVMQATRGDGVTGRRHHDEVERGAGAVGQRAAENSGFTPIMTPLGLTGSVIFFLKGFREAIRVADFVAVPYLALNVIVLLWCGWRLVAHPELLAHWHASLVMRGDWTIIFLASARVFPSLALGLSGFETGVSVMPLVSGKEPGKSEETIPGRILSTRKLLVTAALIMSVMLLLSSLITAALIPETAYKVGGAADGRAIAYLAHLYMGNIFGTIYDLSTILILWFAGASAMAGLLNLIPRYLPRFGMAPDWVAYQRPLVLILLAVDIVVTVVFKASVSAQGGAYATGVLVLMLSAAIAVTICSWKECSIRKPWMFAQPFYFLLVTFVFIYTVIVNVRERPDGAIIASIFIILLLTASGLSRVARSTEMRVSEATFMDNESAQLWDDIVKANVNLVPNHTATPEHRAALAHKVREHYKVEGTIAFLHVNLLDNRSEFLSPLRLHCFKEGEHFVIAAFGAVATANSIAYISELLQPRSLVLGLTRRTLMKQSLEYIFFGEGETGLLVYSILIRYWELIKRTMGLPLILLVSESAYADAADLDHAKDSAPPDKKQ